MTVFIYNLEKKADVSRRRILDLYVTFNPIRPVCAVCVCVWGGGADFER